jgi:glycosyltransferase involved in cell wall biosynthesis
MAPSGRVVVHVVPCDLLRGAQVYAHALRDALDEPGESHTIVSLFAGERDAPPADVVLGVASGPLRRTGFDPRAALALRRELRRLRPDVAIAHGGEPLPYLAAVAPRGTRVAYLRIGAQGPTSALSRARQRWALRRTALVVAVSDAAAADVVADAPGEVHVIPNGRDPAPFAAPATRGGQPPQVLFVGHLDDDKRPLRFVDVVRAVRARGVDARAAIVGDGPLLDAVCTAAGGDVDVLGHRGDVPALLLGADVLVMTSRPPEGMPGVLIEAALAGLPAVTTDVPGARDVVADGETGFVVPVDDLDAMVDRVADLVADPDRRAAMGAAARHRGTQFTLDVTIGRWRQLLASVTAGRDR